MDSNVFISYIIPCYKIADYLPRCLESLSKQSIDSGEEVEFIMVNDGSPDNCLEILKEFALKDQRAIVIDQKNQGVSAARNAGLKKAIGKYVFFLDGDDFLTDDASQILYDVSKESEGDIIVTNAFKVREDAWETKTEWNTCGGLAPGKYDPVAFAKEAKILPISFKAYRRELLVKNDIVFDRRLRVGEVFAFFIHVLSYSSMIVYTDNRIMNYTVREGSVMRTIDIDRDSSILLTAKTIDICVKERIPQLRGVLSYKRALFAIINMFGLIHFVRMTSYTSEIRSIINTIYNDKMCRDIQKYFLFKKPGLYKETAYSFFLFIYQYSFLYAILRFTLRNKR